MPKFNPSVKVRVVPPSSIRLWFDDLGEDFPFKLSALKQACPWMHWDQHQRWWQGPTEKLAETLRFCFSEFAPSQVEVVIERDDSSAGDPPRQLRMF